MRSKRQEIAIAMPCIINPEDGRFKAFHDIGKNVETILVIDTFGTHTTAQPEPRWHAMAFIPKRKKGRKMFGKAVEDYRPAEKRRVSTALENLVAGAGDSSSEEFQWGIRCVHLFRSMTDEELEELLVALKHQREERIQCDHHGFTIDAYPMGNYVRIRLRAPAHFPGRDEEAFIEGEETVRDAVMKTMNRINGWIDRQKKAAMSREAATFAGKIGELKKEKKEP